MSYVAVSSYISVIKKFGGVTAVLVGTARKVLTLVTSFILFPKIFSWYYVIGGVLALGGLSIASTMDTKKKQQPQDKLKKSPDVERKRDKEHHGSEAHMRQLNMLQQLQQTDEECVVPHIHSA